VTDTRGLYTRPLDSGVEHAGVVGARGVGLSLMLTLGLPVPPCFAITVDAFREWRSGGQTMPAPVWRELRQRLHEMVGAGDAVRSRSIAVRLSPLRRASEAPTHLTRESGQAAVEDVTAADLERLVGDTCGAVDALWRRHVQASSEDGRDREIALIVERVIAPGLERLSGRGLIVSRDPVTGSPSVVVRFREAMAGEQSWHAVDESLPVVQQRDLPGLYEVLEDAAVLVESVVGDMAAIEFFIDGAQLWLLDTFVPRSTGTASLRVAVDMIDEALVDKREGLRRIPLWALEQAQAPVFARQQALEVVARTLPVTPGAGGGKLVFDGPAASKSAAGEAVVLVAPAAAGGAAVAHSDPRGVLLVGPSTGPVPPGAFATRPAVSHAPDFVIDTDGQQVRAPSGRVLHGGDEISVDGRLGLVAAGKARMVSPQPEAHVARVLQWCEECRRVSIAESPVGSWQRAGSGDAAHGMHGSRVIVDLSALSGSETRTDELQEVIATALADGASELALVLPEPLAGWDPELPTAPWRLIVAPAALSWAASLLAARVPLDGKGGLSSPFRRMDLERRARSARRLRRARLHP
jgi:hypothetical protein